MKKKTIFTALTATLSAVMVSGSLVTPAYATENNIIAGTMVNGNAIYGTCQYCGLEILTVMDTYAHGKLYHHESRCDKNPDRIKGAQSSAKETVEETFPDFVEETFPDFVEEPETPEVVEDKENKDNSGISTHAESSAKEEVEENFPDPEQPDTPEVPDVPETPDTPEVPEQPEIPETPEVPEQPETPDTPEVPETPEQPKEPVVTITTQEGHNASAKEIIEFTIEFWD